MHREASADYSRSVVSVEKVSPGDDAGTHRGANPGNSRGLNA